MPIWGVNVHKNYSLSVTQYLDLVKAIGLTSIRVDVYDSTQTTKNWLSTLNNSAIARGITVVPVLIPSLAASNTEANAYNAAYAMSRSLSQTFPNMTWEAGNEMNFNCVNPGVDGSIPEHYDTALYNRVRGVVKGFIAGIKSVNPNALVGVGTAGIMFGFLRRLYNDGVRWGYTTEHLYIQPGASADDLISQAPALLAPLAEFGKPIAFTEFNQQDGHGISTDPTTTIALMQAINHHAAQYNIIAAYLYELLDEPLVPNLNERKYGLADENGVLNSIGVAVQNYI